MAKSCRTFDLPELVDGLESGGIVEFVGVERRSEERSVGDDISAHQFVFGAAQSRHLAVDQRNVEVGKLDVVALRALQTTAHAPHSML